jgi:hypothetical protein
LRDELKYLTTNDRVVTDKQIVENSNAKELATLKSKIEDRIGAQKVKLSTIGDKETLKSETDKLHAMEKSKQNLDKILS